MWYVWYSPSIDSCRSIKLLKLVVVGFTIYSAESYRLTDLYLCHLQDWYYSNVAAFSNASVMNYLVFCDSKINIDLSWFAFQCYESIQICILDSIEQVSNFAFTFVSK